MVPDMRHSVVVADVMKGEVVSKLDNYENEV